MKKKGEKKPNRAQEELVCKKTIVSCARFLKLVFGRSVASVNCPKVLVKWGYGRRGTRKRQQTLNTYPKRKGRKKKETFLVLSCAPPPLPQCHIQSALWNECSVVRHSPFQALFTINNMIGITERRRRRRRKKSPEAGECRVNKDQTAADIA